ncbi:MAG TPA: putative baseplate assembly protein [Niabella sp.]
MSNKSDTCHFCEGLSVQTPVRIDNRSGLSAIAYRVGTHSSFKESLLARLSLIDHPMLNRLTSRTDDDFTIAWLDAFSMVGDVLTFYQERIANESYLQTATERFSVLQLARLIGYELRPGVAASTCIAFTLENANGVLGPVLPANKLSNQLVPLPPVSIEKGVKIQSIPGPGEKVQTYETIEPVEGRPEWNDMHPRMSQPQNPLNEELLLLQQTNNNLKKGDALLIRKQDGSNDLKTILNYTTDEDLKTTRVDIGLAPVLPVYNKPALEYAVFSQFYSSALLLGSTVNSLINKSWKEADLSALVKANKWTVTAAVQSINTISQTLQPPAEAEVYAMRKNTQVFGYNASKKVTYDSGGKPNDPENWTERDHSETAGVLYLDNKYEEVLTGSYIVIQNPVATPSLKYYKVDSAHIMALTRYGISTKTTQLKLIPEDQWWGTGTTLAAIRNATVYIQSEKLELAPLPVEDIVTGDALTLDRYYPGLKEGQLVVLSGECSDLPGVANSELLTLKSINVIQGFTDLGFQQSLAYNYIRKSVTINANVAKATHGETTEEVLGSGNAGLTFQKFTLKQPPLTFVSAASSSGIQSTLEIRVNNLLWKEVDYFLDHGPDERIYITRRDNEGNTTVIFGDGITGARVPSGSQNIKATYRKGIGTAGLVAANQLSQLVTKPLGVKSAVNPVAPAGAEDPEDLAAARNNAGLTIRALDRIVSLQDYEDFARAFAGIDKALATWTWLNGKRQVFITVAGSNGQAVKKADDLYTKLVTAIKNAGNSRVAIWLETYSPRFFRITAGIIPEPEYVPADVLAAVEANLRTAFSFEKRRFAQPVTYSEVITCIQQTAGVAAVDIDALYRTEDSTPNIQYFIDAAQPRITATDLFAAELLTLDPTPVDLKIIQ